jgi:hypothetical protein
LHLRKSHLVYQRFHRQGHKRRCFLLLETEYLIP